MTFKSPMVALLLGVALSPLTLAALAPAAMAQEAAPAPAPAAADATDATANDIVVLGFGQTRQVQTVTAADISLLPPGTSPLKAISKLPGVNFQSADPFGAYEWSARITIRGFNQNQLGFTLDGVPLGDMSYGNYNGLHISRAIISENTAAVTVSQGAGSLGTASTSNLGGTLQFTSRDPGHEAAIAASVSGGDHGTFRGFVRAESGDMGNFRGYLSYARLDAGKWRGDGAQIQDQVNAKVVGDIGEGKMTAFVNYSYRRENDYQDMSQEMINRLGYFWDNHAPDWASAYRDAAVYQNQQVAAGSALPYPSYGTSFTSPETSVDDAYYDAAGIRRDWLGSVKFETPLTEHVRASLQGYYHQNKGQGLWWTPYVASPSGAPLSVRTTEYSIKRSGILADLFADFGPNKFNAGIWYESNPFRQARRYYGLDNTLAGSSRSSLGFQSDPFYTQWDYKFKTDTFVYHVSDTVTLGDLTLNLGWKGIKVDNSATAIVSTNRPSGDIGSQDMFLPQVGALYHISNHAEVFANYTENMRAFVSAITSGPFSTTQEGFDAIKGSLKPEKSKTIEGGLRARSGPLQGSIAAYYVDFSNRLLAISSGPGIVGSPSILANVGSVRSYGFEAAATMRLPEGFSATASYAYNNSTYRDDVVDGSGAVVATKGKTVVDTPHHIASAEIAYNGPVLFGRFGANYMSKRFYSYVNDAVVSGRTLFDMSLGVKVPEGHGYLTGVALEGAVTNLFDKKYISTIGTNGFTNSGDSQTLLTGAPRQWTITLRKGF